jgi:hypothetical protein
MEITLSGITTLVIEEQLRNAEPSIAVTPKVNVTVKRVEPLLASPAALSAAFTLSLPTTPSVCPTTMGTGAAATAGGATGTGPASMSRARVRARNFFMAKTSVFLFCADPSIARGQGWQSVLKHTCVLNVWQYIIFFQIFQIFFKKDLIYANRQGILYI